ncbi:ribonuclease HII [Candidatus Saccharibacteria bacterium]|nr:ribonuclease HII [Candidatus Saccharibacteria bacterium]
MILGIDEVGRGPWAGPLVVGAVVLGGAVINGLTDSKKLTKKRRDELDIVIREQAKGIGLGWVHAEELDRVGLSAALVLATKRAVEQVRVPYHEIIIDGTVNFLNGTSKGPYVTTLKKADLLIPSVSAASIVAKVARDAYMTEQDSVYPGYSFTRHVGYGTAVHQAAINLLGVTPLHRLSFAPLQKYAKKDIISHNHHIKEPSFASKTLRTSKAIGDLAENEAAQYLVRAGHDIVDRNWKTKFCEIDIVSKKDDIIYFTEVKYRRQSQQGGGLAAITHQKLRQMKFAAEFFALTHQLLNTNLRLAAASVTGEPPEVETFLEVE